MSPLPEDVQLPCGWVCKRASEDELVFSHREGDVEVEATRTDDAGLLPFDVPCGWELTCRMRAGESVSERIIGRVTTRAAAVEALYSCMECVTMLVQAAGSTGGLTPARIVEGVELRDEIPSVTPNRPSSGGERQMKLTH